MITLVTSYYIDSDPHRQAEIDSCLIKNCKVFDRVLILVDMELPNIPENVQADNLDFFVTAKRATFKHAFNLASTSNPNGINVIANSDIYFKLEDLEKIKKLDYSKTCLALSRVDELSDGTYIHWHKRDSQDAFVFKGEMFLGEESEFSFGIPGCDNRICKIMSEHKPVYNPCNDISIYHLHNTSKRNYTKKDKVEGEYLLVSPCSINNKKDADQFYSFQHKSVGVQGRRMSKDIMLSIMIPTLESRRTKYVALITELFKQIDEGGYGNNVEIVKKCDDGTEAIGYKRNRLLKEANGEYVVSIDDDDDISPKYIEKVITAMKGKPDCITFNGRVLVNNKNPRDYNFSIEQKEYKYIDHYLRPPGHLTPIRREIAQQFLYKELPKELDRGSDVDWSMQIVKSDLIKTSNHINDCLYIYNRILYK